MSWLFELLSDLRHTTFAHPWYLLGLLLVPLVMRRWRRRAQPAMRYSDTGVLAALPPGRSRWVQYISAGVRATVLTLLVVALAGPRLPDLKTRIPTQGIAIAILVDVSGSMGEKDFDWEGEPITRIDAVRRAFGLFVAGGEGPNGEHLEGRPGDLISLIVFATRPDTICPLTLSHGVLMQELAKQEPRTTPGESTTNISDAITEAVARLQQAGPKRKIILLLSDGEHNVDKPQCEREPVDAAHEFAGTLGIPIYAIDAGSENPSALEGAPKDDMNRERGLKTLREVARVTGGTCFPAHDTATLIDVCKKIDNMERAPIESYQYRLYREGFPCLGLAAFTLMMGIVGLELTVWQKIP
jgi:Ca-activated chloride channel homolog